MLNSYSNLFFFFVSNLFYLFFFKKVIKERKNEIMKENANLKNELFDDETGRKRRMAFLDSLIVHHLNDSNSLTEKGIREEVDTFMFEGHDTTSMALSWTTYLIGLNPDIQKKCHEELDSIFGDDKDRPLTMQDLRQMKYVEACIKEGLRLFPSVPYIARVSNQEIIINGHLVPKGVTLLLYLHQVHRDPEVFPKPEVYMPERFLDPGKMHPFAFVPFSAGPRNCIGQKFALLEEKAIISSIFRNFNVTSIDHRDKIKVATELVLRPKIPIKLKLDVRH